MNPALLFPDVIGSPLSGALTPLAFVAMVVMKATLVLAVGTVAAIIARRAGAAVRHAIIALTLAAALALPLGMIATPTWRVSILPASVKQVDGLTSSPGTAASVALPVAGTTAPGSVARSKSQASAAISPSDPTASTTTTISSQSSARQTLSTLSSSLRNAWIPLTWLLGVLSILVWMIVGRIGLRRLARNATPLDTPEWQRLVDDERARAGVDSAVKLLSSSQASTPLAWGTRSPVIVLPDECGNWPREHRAVVLRHELAHIARGDALTQTLAGITCAVYWFHPLVWVAARKLRTEQERACDDRVLSSGTPPTEYAVHLLEVARSARALGAHGWVSLAMARPSQLEGRLLAVLNQSRPRGSMSPVARIIGAGVALLTFVAISAFSPMRRAAALPRAVTPTIIATQFVPPRSPVTLEKTGASKLSETAQANPGSDSLFDRTVDVRSGETLVMDLTTGAALTITGWDQERVRVNGRLGGRDWRDTEVTLDRTRSGARLSTRYTGSSRSHSTSHHFDIQVPRRFNIRVSSGGGAISISGVQGEFTGSTGGGGILIERAGGHAELATGGGAVRVADSNLSGMVSTGGGSVLIQRVQGGLRGSSGSGPIVYGNAVDAAIVSAGGSARIGAGSGGVTVGAGANVTINEGTGEIRDESSGRIIYRKSGGHIDVDEAMNGADVSTGGGSIDIGRSAGKVSATTGGGDITIGPLDGSASAHTGAGDVRITLRGAGDHSVDVTSGNGTVTLVLPSNFSGRVELETAYTQRHGRTRIESDWSLSPTETDYWDDSHGTARKYIRANQTIGSGSGGVLRVRTVNGDVVLRRTRP